MTANLTRADGTNTPVGSLANYSMTHTAVPVDPRDSGQIPSFTATFTDPTSDPRALVGSEVTLKDWTSKTTSGRITSTGTNAKSGAHSIDVNTISERLNTEQTTMPIVYAFSSSANPVREAIAHMLLMAGVPRERVKGKLLQYIDTSFAGTSNYGYIADSISKFRVALPVNTWERYIPSADTNTAAIEVIGTQTIIFGGAFVKTNTLSEIRISSHVTADNVPLVTTLRRNNNAWSLFEKLDNGSERMLLSRNWTPTTSDSVVYCFVEIKANGATNVDVNMRLMERTADGETYYIDTPAGNIYSELRNRPRPYEVALGYNNLLFNNHTGVGKPASYFMLESGAMPLTVPGVNYVIDTGADTLSTDWKNKTPQHIPGFTGNVWDKLKEFCALVELDMSFEDGVMHFRPRDTKRTAPNGDFIPALRISKSNLSEQVNLRESAKSVEVNLRTMTNLDADFNNALLWKAETVYSLDRGERKEETISTKASFVTLHQPVPVSGVPVPYTSYFSSYVITGNDGYIVDPTWWNENGGSIKVYSTGVSGEIKIVMQAPMIDTVRAPYRVSEGAADRPALYIRGVGMLMSEPKPIKIFTGAEEATQDVGVTFDSIFVTKPLLAYNIGHKLAVAFGTTEGSVKFDVNRVDYHEAGTDGVPKSLLADCIYWGGSYYRIMEESTTPQRMSIAKAEQFNTISAVNGEYATGKTVADWNTLHSGKRIRDTNVSPLPIYVG